ncbi:MAG: deoxyhypusine synthase family protein [Deltaproteobacteria bacterium]|nr:deoxyhypusine synthase family protein [Deltaproteobacteria bacterium]
MAGEKTAKVSSVLTPELRASKKKILKTPVKQLGLTRGFRVADLVGGMKGMSIQARAIGQCAEVLDGIYTDKKRPTVLLGLAGPLIAAGLRNVIRELVTGGYVDVIVSTGAIMYQDIYQARGFHHYKGTTGADDTILRDHYIDRIYDTYVDEEAFWNTDLWLGRIADELPPGNYSSRQYLDFVGSKLDDPNSIVRACHERGIPIFCPALNDSSIGIGLTDHRNRHIHELDKSIAIDSIQDNYELTQIVVKSKSTAAFYVAGGVPKNYINDSIVMGYIFGLDRGHDYALQVTTAVTMDGGLSSSTLGEAQSWGKIDRKAHFAMAWVEPSVSIPLLAAYVFDTHKGRPALKLNWAGQILKKLERPAK